MRQIQKTGLLVIFTFLFISSSIAQEANQLVQTIRGVVTDKSSGEPIAYATVVLDNTQTATTSNEQGEFSLPNITIGRHTITVSLVGHETAIIKEILVSSTKESLIEVTLIEKAIQLNEVVVAPKINKAESLNEMALVGTRMFSTEEAGRYAGGLDDPARLASSFAGVAPQTGSSNGISIHGNAPSLLQWRVEDIEVSNPNHFADMEGLGGGFLSSLSSNVLGNSNFLIGAFPAEYSNAVSGVFDLKMRNGNNRKYQHAFQFGMLGIDFASEGPMSKKHNASYIVNYRYSTTGVLSKISPEGVGGVLDYQDLNFKLNFPTKKAGVFSVWGTGLIDKADPIIEESSKWKYKDDGLYSSGRQKSGATGVSHRYFFSNRKTSLKTTLAATYMDYKIDEEFYDFDNTHSPRTLLEAKTTNLVLTSALNNKFSARHTNKTGFTVTNTGYDMNFDFASTFGQPLENVTKTNGNMNLISAYTSSLINLNNSLELDLGLSGQYFTLNKNTSIEPRASLKWQANPKNSFAIGYGLHSRTEKADVYFVKDENGNLPNKNLDFIKSHHFLFSYTYRISEDMNLKIEPYYQPLYDVAVAPEDSYSILNRKDFYITKSLESKGKARNYGVDLTFEKYLTKGLYYMVTASIFDSKYQGGDSKWYNTRYNRNYVINGLIGKEWIMGRNMLSANFKGTYMGGQRYTPVNEAATMAHPDKEVQYDETKMYSEQFSPMFIANFTISYKMNRKNVAHEFAFKSVNTARQKEYIQHKYNVQTYEIEPFKRANSLINISYKLEF